MTPTPEGFEPLPPYPATALPEWWWLPVVMVVGALLVLLLLYLDARFLGGVIHVRGHAVYHGPDASWWVCDRRQGPEDDLASLASRRAIRHTSLSSALASVYQS